jgi:putative transposase
MKRKRYSEEQIVRILGEARGGQSIAETCRKYGVSEQTVYRWRSKYEGMNVSEVRRMKELEEENFRLKRIVAQQAMDIDALKEINAKKW